MSGLRRGKFLIVFGIKDWKHVIHSPEFYKSCSWLLEKEIFLPFIPSPWLCSYQSWWSSSYPQYLVHLQFALFSASFNLNVWFTPGSFPLEVLRPAKMISMEWDREQALTRKYPCLYSSVKNFMRFGCWKLCSFHWILRYKTPQYVQSSDKQHFNSAVFLQTHDAQQM